MNKRFRYFWLSLKMFWHTFSLRARVGIAAAPVICVLILLFAPGREFWQLLCGITLALTPLTVLAIYFLFREIK